MWCSTAWHNKKLGYLFCTASLIMFTIKIYITKNIQLEEEQWHHFFYFVVVMYDEEDTCLLLNSEVALLADFDSTLSGLNFVAFGLANFTVRIDSKVLKPMLAVNGVLFLFTMLNILSSDALEGGSTSTSFATLNKRLNISQCNLSFHLYILIKYQLCSTWFFHHNNYKHSAKLNLVYHGHWVFDNQETAQKGHLPWLDHSTI